MRILGVFIIVLGIAAALYVGVWVMAVGGIIQLIEGAKMNPVNSSMVAWGIVRFFLASLAGGLCWWIGFFIGAIFFTVGEDDAKAKRRGQSRIW